MTFVFFLFFLHLSIGILLTLPFTMARAGRSYFKLCSASAAFMITAGLWLLYRRFGWEGPPGTVGAPLLWATAALLLAVLLLNRSYHFYWHALKAPALALALVSGAAAVWFGAPPSTRLLQTAVDGSSALLLGAAAAAMTLGHYYLVVVDLPIKALRRLTIVLIVALILRGLLVAALLVGPVHAGYAEARLVAAGFFRPDGVFIWMRVLFGILGPLSLIYFIWRTVEIRSTQSATGILYVQLFLVLAGELLAKYLRVAAGLPL